MVGELLIIKWCVAISAIKHLFIMVVEHGDDVDKRLSTVEW